MDVTRVEIDDLARGVLDQRTVNEGEERIGTYRIRDADRLWSFKPAARRRRTPF